MEKVQNQSLAAQWAGQEKIRYEASAAFTQHKITLVGFENILYNSFLRILYQLDDNDNKPERLTFLYAERAKQVMIRDNDQGEDYYISNAQIYFLDALINKEEIGD